jgi:hypothetical protein
VVVVKDEPEADTSAVKAEVVTALAVSEELPVAAAAPPMPKMVVWPVVVVKDEPEAETRAVRSEVVIALLDSVALPPAPAPPTGVVTVAVTVAVEDAEPVSEPVVDADAPLPLAAAEERMEMALPVTDALAVEVKAASAFAQ